MKWIIIVMLAVISSNNYLFGQSDSVKYTHDYKFVTGIYLSYNDFKTNNPTIKQEPIIRNVSGKQFPLDNMLYTKKIYYHNNSIKEDVKLKRGEFWGCCSENVVYIHLNNVFHQILRFGAIILFVRFEPALIYDTGDPPTSVTRTPYFIDFYSGKKYEVNIETFQELIKDDTELYDEFMSLKRKSKKKKAMYQFLNRYNERHPIYFPVVN